MYGNKTDVYMYTSIYTYINSISSYKQYFLHVQKSNAMHAGGLPAI